MVSLFTTQAYNLGLQHRECLSRHTIEIMTGIIRLLNDVANSGMLKACFKTKVVSEKRHIIGRKILCGKKLG
ncbi:hypothetical protein HALA3H3_830009 [Halomonas sp. A3H3]|nr:hypothetical protein HALA3H3_830009 [Halomonas sp. A3H3]